MSAANKKRTIDEKMADLRQLTAWFHGDDFSIEQATDKFKEAENLAREIDQDLSAAKNEITILKQKFDNEA